MKKKSYLHTFKKIKENMFILKISKEIYKFKKILVLISQEKYY